MINNLCNPSFILVWYFIHLRITVPMLYRWVTRIIDAHIMCQSTVNVNEKLGRGRRRRCDDVYIP